MSVRVGLGLANFPFSGPRPFWRWVETCEESAVDSLWQSERLVSDVAYLEPMSLMASLAGGTDRLKFGMTVVVASLRDPLLLAKECATIDYLSDGRLLPAFGVGSDLIPEWRATGRDPAGRGRRADELFELCARLWSEEKVSFSGEFYRYTDARIEPKPKQQPLPLWIGGSSRAAIRRTARLGTGWLAGIQTPGQVAPVVEAIRKETEAVGRSIDPDHYGAGFSFRFGSWEEPIVQRSAELLGRLGRMDPREYLAVGGAGEIVARAREYVDAGISKFVLRPVAAGDAEFQDQTERLIAEVIPRIHD
jgi:probable F420-dependent oxidoreductase